MGLFDRIGREISKGIGAIGTGIAEFGGGIVGGALGAFNIPGAQTLERGALSLPQFLGGRIGVGLGDIGERILGEAVSGLPGGGGRGAIVSGAAPGTFLGGTRAPTVAPSLREFVLPQTITRPETVEAAPGPIQATEVSMAGIQAAALPGGALIAPLLRGIGGAALGGAAVGGAISAFGGGGGVDLPFGGALFRVTPFGVRARSLVRVENPFTGNDVYFRNVGRPILFAGDFATCRRVQKVARRARRSRGR